MIWAASDKAGFELSLMNMGKWHLEKVLDGTSPKRHVELVLRVYLFQ